MICLSRCIEFSPYSNDTASEDVRLAQVYAVLQAGGHQASIDDHKLADLSTSAALREHAQAIAALNFRIIVFFIRQRSSGLHFTRRWIELLRSYLPDVDRPILALAGDTAVGFGPFLKDGVVDIVLQGDEDTVAATIGALAYGASFNKVEGVVFLRGGRLSRRRPRLPSTSSLDRLPHPTLYAAHSEAVRSGRLRYLPNLRATRGCYARCSFCHESISFYDALAPRHRHVSIEWLTADIQRVVDAGAREIMFQDSNFLPQPGAGDEWVAAFVHMMRTRFPSVAFSFWTRAQDLTPTRVVLLRQSKLSSVLIGIESLIDSRLHKLRKGLRSDQIRSAIRSLQENGIEGKLSFILFDPESTVDSVLAELQEIEKLFRECPDVQRNPIFAWNILTPHPNTPLHDEYTRRGLLGRRPERQFVEQFSFMAGRLIGDTEPVDIIHDDTVAVLCEAFRLYQFEYARKWYAVLQACRENETEAASFFWRLPLRMLPVLRGMAEQAESFRGMDLLCLQADLTATLYTCAKADYEVHLPPTLRSLETPATVPYAASWNAIFRVGEVLAADGC